MTQREHLLEFLDSGVFLPTLNAQSSAYADASERKLLKGVQRRVLRSKVRYFAYLTAADIKKNFMADLSSMPGQELASDMWLLKLPRFEDVRGTFLALCRQLDV